MYINETTHKHWIRTDTRGNIIEAWSDAIFPEKDTTGAIMLTDKGGYQFRFTADGEENPSLFYELTEIPLYTYINGYVYSRTQSEIDTDKLLYAPIFY